MDRWTTDGLLSSIHHKIILVPDIIPKSKNCWFTFLSGSDNWIGLLHDTNAKDHIQKLMTTVPNSVI